MMRLTRTGIGLLTAQYRSVLRKCFLINAGVFFALAPNVASACNYHTAECQAIIKSWGGHFIINGSFYAGHDTFFTYKPDKNVIQTEFHCGESGCGYYAWYEQIPNEYGPYSEGDAEYGAIYDTYASYMASMSDTEKSLLLKYDAKYAMLSTNGTYAKATYSVAENIAALDAQVAANTSTIAAHTAVINALDNNYYRNIKFSRAEKYKKSPLAERSECIQGSTDFFKKFEDALTIAAQSRHDGLIFVANDNHATTGNTTMYKKEA